MFINTPLAKKNVRGSGVDTAVQNAGNSTPRGGKQRIQLVEVDCSPAASALDSEKKTKNRFERVRR